MSVTTVPALPDVDPSAGVNVPSGDANPDVLTQLTEPQPSEQSLPEGLGGEPDVPAFTPIELKHPDNGMVYSKFETQEQLSKSFFEKETFAKQKAMEADFYRSQLQQMQQQLMAQPQQPQQAAVDPSAAEMEQVRGQLNQLLDSGIAPEQAIAQLLTWNKREAVNIATQQVMQQVNQQMRAQHLEAAKAAYVQINTSDPEFNVNINPATGQPFNVLAYKLYQMDPQGDPRGHYAEWCQILGRNPVSAQNRQQIAGFQKQQQQQFTGTGGVGASQQQNTFTPEQIAAVQFYRSQNPNATKEQLMRVAQTASEMAETQKSGMFR